jgi:tetratricopeptide (TPR) repeat protein
MSAERDELVKFTFPELRRRCREHAVEFVEVDLRWGVTDEEKSEGKVLPICLAEIDRCRPYFIGLLGERYGWVPETVDEQLATQQPWLLEHKEKSVTDLEIVHGVLKNPEMKGLAFFYFRDPESSRRVEEDMARQPDYRPEPEPSREKLNSLKEKIQKSDYPVFEGFSDPKTLGARILEDLWAVIDKRFPEETVPTPLERERMDHEAFAAARTRVYIGREEYFQKLDKHIAGDGPPLVLLGESGSGKSALLANWASRYREAYPNDFLVTHYVGSSADSADYVRILRRVMEEIRTRYPEPSVGLLERREEEIPLDPKKVVEAFPLWIAKATARVGFILVLDALNQLEDKDNAPDLGWLPGYFPPGVRVVLSTLPGRSLDALKRKGWPTYSVIPLDAVERKTLIRHYLSRLGRKLGDNHVERIAAASQSSNPLFLRALLDELRVYGDHHTLGLRIDHYLAAETVNALYGRILERYEQDYEMERPGLVRDAMSLLWASRRGLTESELLDLLGSDGKPLPRALMSPLFLAAEESLVSKSGLLNFFHDFLRQAVEDRYLPGSEQKRACHLRLAEYFGGRDLDDRKADELPWQLSNAEELERLKDCLTDLPMFRILSAESKKYELTGYWLLLGTRYDMVESYNAAVVQYERSAPPAGDLAIYLHEVADFYFLNANYVGAEPLFRRALAINEKVLGPEHLNTTLNLNRLANVLFRKGDNAGAEPIYHRALRVCEKTLGSDHLLTTTIKNNIATLMRSRGDLPGAEALYREALGIRQGLKGLVEPKTASILSSLAAVLWERGQYGEAERLHRDALDVSIRTRGEEHPETAKIISNLALVQWSKGDIAGAEVLDRKVLAILKKNLGTEHPFVVESLNNLALVLTRKCEYSEAESLFRQALAISTKVLGTEDHMTLNIIHNLGEVLWYKEDYGGAEQFFRQGLAISQKNLGPEHHDTASSLHNLAAVLMRKGDCSGAEDLFREALIIREKTLGSEHHYTALSLRALADLQMQNGDYAGAEPLYRRALGICEKVLGLEHPDTALSVNNLAVLLYAKGDYAGAEPLYRRALAIFEKVLGPEHPNTATCVNNLVRLLKSKGD